ncbi:hypothetical protein LTR91_010805 [Friedmanniomyces endolithicus]|uniref:Glutathione S-transferase n=1 Tax=Friedmanniomyces endolithicus TaxID=329885 RepID=A0AAN6KIS5_9PEZI|nr:hypothetical protein LTR94_002931 [Friedmanniomyces endolithicus]KAK0793563.1 hypothetical protein LTR75_011104 [Friedmanniomyces endolithicus]KAK0801658.1 hypothetical protein LTR59_005371 [Friedmanniomyces endolithicus]KAK0807385.1 hypothetical protein LTR38_004931 [Friedmanniomyces endolithicus]KAK0845802.1 hypothetical protein LTR03_007198 [Friedmanniomyces endolithicus]
MLNAIAITLREPICTVCSTSDLGECMKGQSQKEDPSRPSKCSLAVDTPDQNPLISTTATPVIMPLTVHHLQVSQSERIVWLCEELGITYELKLYQRSPVLSPPSYLALHPIGAAPVITDGDDVTLAESEAVVEYILNVHGNGGDNFVVKPSAGRKEYAEYLYWLHFVNGTLQPAMGRACSLRLAGVDEDNNQRARVENKLHQALSHLDNRLKQTGAWLAGQKFTVADVMIVFSLTTMRRFMPLDLGMYEGILGYLGRVGGREGYRRAMKKGDPEMDVKEAVKGPPPEMFAALKGK